MIGVKVTGADTAARALLAKAVLVEEGSERVVEFHGQMLLARIQARASGRPGPRVQTGNYRRSWRATPLPQAVGAGVEVGTNAPQANRLEHGFVGTDSLGRHYNQPPFPHVGPAVQEVEPTFVAAMEALAGA